MVKRIKVIKEEALGVISILGSLYLFISLITHYIGDPVLFFRTTEPPEPVRNLGGIVGAYVSGWLIILFGFAAFIIPLLLIAFGIKRLMGKEGHKIYLLGGNLILISSSLMLSLLSHTFNITVIKYPDGIGGLIGRGIANLANQFFSILGAYILSLSVFLSSIILLSPVSITALAFRKRQKTEDKGRRIEDSVSQVIEDIRQGIEASNLEKQNITISESEAVKPIKRGGYEFPSLELLGLAGFTSMRPSKEELLTDPSLIEKKLGDFSVEGRITQGHPGPIVTMYEFEPAPGVKINRVVSLSDDLSLALRAQSVRVSPIPGKAAIGIEVPNRQREIVSTVLSPARMKQLLRRNLGE